MHPAAWWGLFGLTVILSNPIARLAPMAVQPILDGMAGWQWALYLGNLVFFAYSEGYRGFQKQFSPRVAARAWVITQGGSTLRYVLAPFFLMGLMHATPHRKRISWTLLLVIVTLVVLVRMLPQPWRGIVDGGVVLGLSWGLVTVWIAFARMLRTGAPPAVDPELP